MDQVKQTQADHSWQNRIVGSGEESPQDLMGASNPDNPRLHPERQGEALEAVIDVVGLVARVTKNIRTGNLLDGHLRVKLALARGETSLPVDYVDLSPEEEKLVLGTFDPVTSLAGFDAARLLMLKDEAKLNFDFDLGTVFEVGALDLLLGGVEEPPGGGDEGPPIDKAEELREVWQTEVGQVWALGEHRLACGDCTDPAVVEGVMGGEKADMVFTDPPYMTFASSTGKLEPNDFNMLAPFWEKLIKMLVSNLGLGKPMFICCDWRSYPTLFTEVFRHAAIKNLVVWDFGGAMKLGPHFRPSYELLVYAVNSKFAKSWKDKRFDTWKITDRSARDLWTIPQSEAAPGINREHTSQKPIALVAQAINYCSFDGGLILDPFLGSGTTLIAAHNLNRRCYGIELDPGYAAVCLQRMADIGLTPKLTTTQGANDNAS